MGHSNKVKIAKIMKKCYTLVYTCFLSADKVRLKFQVFGYLNFLTLLYYLTNCRLNFPNFKTR